MRYFISHCGTRFTVLHPNNVVTLILLYSDAECTAAMLEQRRINTLQKMYLLLSNRETSRADYEYFMERYWQFQIECFNPEKSAA